MRICQKWSITQMESKPAWSAVRAMSASVLPSLAGPAGQVKSAMSSPIFMAAPQGRISVSSMKPLLCIRNDRDDTLGITCGTLATAGVPLMRLDAFDAGVQWPDYLRRRDERRRGRRTSTIAYAARLDAARRRLGDPSVGHLPGGADAGTRARCPGLPSAGPRARLQ